MQHLTDAEVLDKMKSTWIYWQSEESRDRGYNFDLCKSIREEYYLYKTEAEKRNIIKD